MSEVISMARVGRPAKAGKRYPGGKLVVGPKVDKGTDEAQARRAWLAGGQKRDYLATNPLDVLFANDALSLDEHRIACSYAQLYGQCLRRAIPPASTGAKGGGDEPGEETQEKREAKLRRMWNVLDLQVAEHGRLAREVWDNLVVHQRYPRWMLPVIPRRSDFREAQLFKVVTTAMTKAMTAPSTVKAA